MQYSVHLPYMEMCWVNGHELSFQQFSVYDIAGFHQI